MLDTTSGLKLDVERGPDWMFVRVNPPEGKTWDDAPPLAEAVWAILEQNFIYRVVLELDQITLLRSCLIGQLVMLSKRVHTHDGLLRICGLSPDNQEVLSISRLSAILPNYRDRGEAVMASRPSEMSARWPSARGRAQGGAGVDFAGWSFANCRRAVAKSTPGPFCRIDRATVRPSGLPSGFRFRRLRPDCGATLAPFACGRTNAPCHAESAGLRSFRIADARPRNTDFAAGRSESENRAETCRIPRCRIHVTRPFTPVTIVIVDRIASSRGPDKVTIGRRQRLR